VSQVPSPQLSARDIIAKKYEIDSPLGAGPQGTTYLARDMSSGRKVALKLLAGPAANDDDAQDVLRRSQALTHDGIVRLTDTGIWEEPGTRARYRWVTMDFIEGETLRRLLDSLTEQKQSLTVPEAAQILVKILEAVAYAHSPDGFVHRHLKPTNIIIQTKTVGGRPVRSVKIVGFGISDLVSDDAQQRASVTPYHAPGTFDAQGGSTKLDTYAAGIMLYEMLCGQPPKGTYLPPSRVRDLGDAPLPQRIDAIVFVATNFQADNRYPSAANMLVDVQRAVTDIAGVQDALSPKVVIGAVAASVLVLAAVAAKLYSDDGAAGRADEELRAQVVASTVPPAKEEVERRLAGHPNMVWVPGGEYVKGRLRSEPTESVSQYEPTATRTAVKGYYIDMFEWPNTPDSQARVVVTAKEAEDLCATAGKRLCSDDEWEKACKGPNNTHYAFDVPPGADGKPGADTFNAEICGDVARDTTQDAQVERKSGSAEKCRSGYGAFDMSGGAAEWTATPGAGEQFRRTKGGSFGKAAQASRCAAHFERRADLGEIGLSFRCCLDENAPAGAAAPAAAPADAAAAPASP
jgi:formylglycine-generating enzyme required for sulfatase activity